MQMIEKIDFMPGQHLMNAGLAALDIQIKAANRWIAETPSIRVLNVETLFTSSVFSGSGVISNTDPTSGVRVWFTRGA